MSKGLLDEDMSIEQLVNIKIKSTHHHILFNITSNL